MKKRNLLLLAALFCGAMSYAQVGVGTFTPDSSAEMEILSTKKGLLIPRVALVSTTVSTPITGVPAESLIIYNTASLADVKPGYYYWSQSKWKRLMNEADLAALEKITTLMLNADGHTLEYKNETDLTNTIDLATVITNFETVTELKYDLALNKFTYKDENGVINDIDVSALVKKNETLTTLALAVDGKTLTYTGENGTPTTIDLSTVIAGFENLTELKYDATLNTLKYKDEDNTIHSIDIATLVKKNETLTTLALAVDGKTLTYTGENGTPTTIDLSAVISGFENLTELKYDATLNTLKYKDEDNTIHTIDIATLVKKNETLTSLVNNNDGTITYKDERGVSETVDIKGTAYNWSLKGNTNTTASDFIGTTDAKPLSIKTNGTERVHITSDGNVGIGTSAPNTSFQVVGSESKSINIKTSNYTVTNTDHTIVYRHAAMAILTLPDPTTCPGRILYIINNGQTDLTISPAIEMAWGVNTTTLSNGAGIQGNKVYGNRLYVQSDGTKFVVIQ